MNLISNKLSMNSWYKLLRRRPPHRSHRTHRPLETSLPLQTSNLLPRHLLHRRYLPQTQYPRHVSPRLHHSILPHDNLHRYLYTRHIFYHIVHDDVIPMHACELFLG